jgi:hypothetical protein
MTPGDHVVAKRGLWAECATDLAQQFIEIDAQTYELFYSSFANQVLWLLQHDFTVATPTDRGSPMVCLEKWLRAG